MKKFVGVIGKIVVVLVLILLIGFVVSRIYCFVIVDKVYHEINNFREVENRYCMVTTFKNGEFKYREEIFKRESKIKYLKLTGNPSKIYFEFKNFNTNKKYFLITKADGSKLLEQNELYIIDKNFMPSSPNLIWKIYSNNNFSIKHFLKIHFIIPVKYDDRECYKIVTRSETVIIDKDSYLPTYFCKKLINSEGANESKMEYFYEFETNTVTEEDMKKM